MGTGLEELHRLPHQNQLLQKRPAEVDADAVWQEVQLGTVVVWEYQHALWQRWEHWVNKAIDCVHGCKIHLPVATDISAHGQPEKPLELLRMVRSVEDFSLTIVKLPTSTVGGHGGMHAKNAPIALD